VPGAYAHITLVNEAKRTDFLERGAVPVEAITALFDYFKYCELGAVSPDYPYLAFTDSGAKEWADAMHYVRTGEMIHAGIRRLSAMKGEAKRKGLAWLLGYTAHVTTDVTIHPVVQMKVGPYKGHEKEHRICEMHQDSYIYQRLKLGGIQRAEHLNSGIAKCSHAADPDKLDPPIVELWKGMLRDVHPDAFRSNSPKPDHWHAGFKFGVGKVAEEGGRLWPLARHVATGQGLVYPLETEIDRQFIDRLATPHGVMGYDEVFNLAIENVLVLWKVVSMAAIQGTRDSVALIGNWDLDTGRDSAERFAFWEAVA